MFEDKDRKLISRYKKKYADYYKEYGTEMAKQMIEGDIHKLLLKRGVYDEKI